MQEVDDVIVQQCTKGNRVAQRKLYAVLMPYLRSVAYRYLQDSSFEKDVLQESFVRIFKNLAKFDARKAPLKNWCARIVINKALDYNKLVIRTPHDELIEEIHDRGNTEDLSVDHITDVNLMRLIKKMPAGYFEVFNLHIIDGYSHREISKMLEISEAVSRKKLSRAKSWLRNSDELLQIKTQKNG
jgi:RNA polymerase sigma factor (sigma-70 family)